MPRWLGSKAQFFIISMVVILAILISIQNLFAGYYNINYSKPYDDPEDFWFWNIKDQITRTIEQRECPELSADFIEIEMVTEEFLGKKGVDLIIENKTPICNGSTKINPITIKMNMTSPNKNLYEEFNIAT
ncbi:MAG: hypothetical protein J7L08_00870 [Candidatus Aenigmarchaeota archaeon]|nr:hypothetical protein [Candidatus Aenigmarchaeota archaeon]